MLSDSRGQSKVSSLIYLFVAILMGYVVVKLVPVYMHYYAMDDEVHQQLKLSKINSVVVIKNDLMEKADELGIAVAPEDLELTFDDEGNLDIYMYWEEEADFGYGIRKSFQFEIDTSAASSEE